MRPEGGILQAAPVGPDEDRRLIARVAARDRAAFQALYFAYHKRLSRFLMRICRRRELAEEIINDTMFAVWQKAGDFRGEAQVSTWILGIAYRQALKALKRSSGRLPVVQVNYGETPLRELGDDAGAAQRELREWIDCGLDSLPAAQRLVIELAYFLGHSCEEIATITNCPVNTVKTRLFHARERLRERLPSLSRGSARARHDRGLDSMTEVRPDPAGVHAQTARDLPFLVNGTLAPEETARAREHLRDCEDCRRELELETALMERVREQGVVDYAPHTSFAKLSVRIDQHEARRAGRAWWRVPARVRVRLRDAVILAQAAAIVVLALIANSAWRDPPVAEYRTLTRNEPAVRADLPRLTVVFDDRMQAGDLRRMLGTIGGTLVDGPSPHGVFTVALRTAATDAPGEAAAVAEWLRAQPGVRLAEVDSDGAARSLMRHGPILLCCLLVGCAGLSERPLPAALTLPVDSASDRQVLVTVPDPGGLPARRPGSTPKGYDAAAGYQVSPLARRAVLELASEFGLRMLGEWPIRELDVHCVVFEIDAGRSRDEVLAALVRDPRVESAQPMQDFVTQAMVRGGDPYRELQSALGAMGVEAAHRWSRGRGVRVAVIDTGLGDGHPELAGRVVEARDFVGAGRADVHAESHGLAVAGLIAASADNGVGITGVAPESSIVAMRACWQTDPAREAACNSFTLALALAAAIDDRAAVINLSLTGPRDPLLERLLDRAIRRGAVVVGAVPEDAPASGSFPTAVADVIAVQSAEAAAGADGPARVLAPGRELLTLAPGGRYDFESGSSLAAAQVSGVVALLLAREPRLSSAKIGSLLSRSAAANGARDEALPNVVNACFALADLLSLASCGPAEKPRVADAREAPAAD